jgi:hypothetical protein
MARFRKGSQSCRRWEETDCLQYAYTYMNYYSCLIHKHSLDDHD